MILLYARICIYAHIYVYTYIRFDREKLSTVPVAIAGIMPNRPATETLEAWLMACRVTRSTLTHSLPALPSAHSLQSSV